MIFSSNVILDNFTSMNNSRKGYRNKERIYYLYFSDTDQTYKTEVMYSKQNIQYVTYRVLKKVPIWNDYIQLKSSWIFVI